MSPQTLKKGKFSSAFETVHYNKLLEDQMRQFETFISPKAAFFNKFVHEIALKFMKFGSTMYDLNDISDILPPGNYMQTMKIGCETYHPTFVKLFGEMIILSTRDTKNISVIDLDTLSEVENIDLKSFAHCIQLVNGKLLAASFHGQVIDIFGVGKCNKRKFRQGVLQRIKSLDTGSPVYCMELLQNGGLLIIGQFEGYVNILDIDNYKSVYQTRVPSERCVRQISKTLGGLSEFCFATDCGLFFGKLERDPMRFKFDKTVKYLQGKLINKFYEYRENWFMVFEQTQIFNKFYILSRVQK